MLIIMIKMSVCLELPPLSDQILHLLINLRSSWVNWELLCNKCNNGSNNNIHFLTLVIYCLFNHYLTLICLIINMNHLLLLLQILCHHRPWSRVNIRVMYPRHHQGKRSILMDDESIGETSRRSISSKDEPLYWVKLLNSMASLKKISIVTW